MSGRQEDTSGWPSPFGTATRLGARADARCRRARDGRCGSELPADALGDVEQVAELERAEQSWLKSVPAAPTS